MTRRGATLFACTACALFCGLALGGRIFYLFAIFGMLSLLFSGVSAALAKRLLRVSCQLSHAKTPRGKSVQMLVTLPARGLLPIAALETFLYNGDNHYCSVCSLHPRQKTSIDLAVPASHVGEVVCGIESVTFSDLLGLFSLTQNLVCNCPLLVLPRDFEVMPLRFLSADDGRALPNRTTEDLSSPEDTRAYRAGDALKRIHWKLSARRHELIVRRFETPAPPDTLILLDCTPPAGDNPAALRDALCETAVSVAAMQMRNNAPVRLPFYGREKGEFLADHSGDLAALKEMLAREDFQSATAFDRVLHLELRRMRRTGATVLLTSRLNAATVEGVKHIRRMGPSVRVYFITHTPDAPQDRPYIAQLQQNLVEVCYVTPA